MPPNMTSFSNRPASTQFKSPGSKYAGIGFVVILHIGIIYALYVSLNQKSIHIIPGDVKLTQIKEDVNKETPPPPPPPPDFKPPPPYIPPPEISINNPAPATTAITAVTTTKAPPAPPPPPAPVEAPKVTSEPVMDRTGVADVPYPAISKRLGEEGSVIVDVTVGPDGIVQDATIEKTSGFPRLDAAAIEYAHKVHFKPGTIDNKPAQMKWRWRYTFRLNT